MINFILSFTGALMGALFGNYIWSKKKWRVNFDDENNEISIEQETNPREAMFISEPTAEDENEALQEINRPEWKKFFDKVRIKK